MCIFLIYIYYLYLIIKNLKFFVVFLNRCNINIYEISLFFVGISLNENIFFNIE